MITDLSNIERGEKIGEGWHGEVYTGIPKVAGENEIVAIKTLSPIVAGSADEERFVREITAQATCKHPCVLPLLGFSPVNSHPIIVTKYVSVVGGHFERPACEEEGTVRVVDHASCLLLVRCRHCTEGYAHAWRYSPQHEAGECSSRSTSTASL